MFNKRKHTDEEIKMLNSKAYRNGFLDGMSLDQKHPQTFTFMGVGIEKLTEIVCKNLDKENKMTREEARKIVFNKCKTLEGRESEYWIDAIEALGLIKFDEPPKRKYIFFPSPDAGEDNLSVYLDDAVKTMKEYGYAVGKHINAIAYDCEIPNALAVIKNLQDRGYVIVEEVIPKWLQ